MNLDIFRRLDEEKIMNEPEKYNFDEISNKEITKEEFELANRLDAIEEYSIDRFEGKLAVLEDRKTGKIKNISKNKLPFGVKEGDIINRINGKFFFDQKQTQDIEEEIRNRFNRLKE